MGFLSFLQKKPEFKPTNVLEELIARQEHETNPRGFFEMLASRDLLVSVLKNESDDSNRRLQIVTHQPQGLGPIAYVFTSEAALQHTIAKQPHYPREFAQLNGRVLMELLIEQGLGMFVNSQHKELVLLYPDNMQFGLSQLDNPSPVGVKDLPLEAGTRFMLGIPRDIPTPLLNSLSAYIRDNPVVRKAIFALAVYKDADGNPTSSAFQILLVPATGQTLTHDDFQRIGAQLMDVWKPEGDQVLDMKAIDEEEFAQMAPVLISVTADGFVNPQG